MRVVCPKCKKELDNNAVFCDTCGSFVMHEEYSSLPNNGYRIRKKRHTAAIWISVFAAIAAVIVGIGMGYMIIYRDFLEREALKYADNTPKPPSQVWEESLTADILNYKDYTTQYSYRSE